MSGKPKILVTGANGQLGKELKDIAATFLQFEFIFLSRADLLIHRFELLRNYFETIKPEYCINCAAYTAVDRAEDEKELAFQVNAEAVGVLAAVCKEHNVKLILISTDYVFDGNSAIPYTENFPPHPVNVYGASKLQGEKEALQLNPDVIIIRTSWLYSSYGKNFVKTILRLLKERNEISVVNDQTGSPTYAADLASVILNIVANCQLSIVNWQPGIYHFSNEGAITWYDFALAIKEYSGSNVSIKPTDSRVYPATAKRPAYSVLDTTKIRNTFHVQLKKWQSSLRACLNKMKD
jgi:dTDP-4-dehydrorhamnose reductase